MKREEMFYKIWMAISNVPESCKRFLKDRYNNEEEIYNLYKISKSNYIKEDYSDRIKRVNDEEVEKLLDIMHNNNIGAVFYRDEDYMDELYHVYEPPYVLFYKGDISKIKSHKKVSIVGSRKATLQGTQLTEHISKELVENGVMVISGGAYGIDTAAHRGALRGNGVTCAVLGCGINVVYPKSNYKLYNDIIKNGVIISEFLPYEKPASYNFPRRNRIIAALCEILIVTEAAERSGSLITTGYALDLGKTIFVSPGNPINPQARGSNRLIIDGANPLYEVQDVLKELNITSKDPSSKNFSGEKGVVLKEIGVNPIHINDLIRRCNIDISLIYGILFELQLENEIISLSGNYYARIS
ncbi:DNA-processing protein DprA [Clostridium sp. UBA1652]|uniref:DNA-processing protein DprA n=1 Tax=Clostridium sp. UBA1652 TaxID=1946348 RepID=UPI00257A1185|nr:DNA-processing protein DprA [Clostridium sp. UBA1652]